MKEVFSFLILAAGLFASANAQNCVVSLPYDVYTTETTIDSCWTLYNASVTNYSIVSSNNSVKSYAVLPLFDMPLSAIHIQLRYSVSDSIPVEIGVMTNAADTNTFQPYDTLYGTGASNILGEFDFGRWTGTDGHIAIRWRQGYLRRVTLDTVYGCYTPYDVVLSNITATSVTVSWRNRTLGAAGYEVGVSRYREYYYTTYYTTENTFVIDSLQPGTYYQVNVRTVCDSGNRYSQNTNVVFCTDCLPVSTLPYRLLPNDLGPTLVDEVPYMNVPCWTYIEHPESGYCYWVSPEFDTTQIRMDHLKLTAALRYTNDMGATLQFGTMNNNMQIGSFSHIDGINLQNNVTNASTGALTFYCNDRSAGRLAFRAFIGKIRNLDSIVIEQEVCHPVKNIVVTNRTDHSLTINWTEQGTATCWIVDCAARDDSFSQSLVATAKPFTINGLASHTIYNVTVRAINEGDTSLPCSKQITTAVDSLHALVTVQIGNPGSSYSAHYPIERSFKHSLTQTIYPLTQYSAAGWIDTVWFYCNTSFNGTGRLDTSLTLYLAHFDTTVARNNNDWVELDSLVEVFHANTWLAPGGNRWVPIPLQTPFFYNGVDELAVVFLHSNSTSRYSGDYFSYSSAGNGSLMYKGDASPFPLQQIASDDFLGSRVTNRPVVRFSMVTSSCQNVSNVHIASVDGGTVRLQWNESGSASQWQVSYTATDGSHSGTLFANDSTVCTIGGLHSNHTYKFSVRPICGEGDTGYYFGNVSTYIETCPVPDSVTVSLFDDPLLSDQAVVSWRENGSATQWEVAFTEVTGSDSAVEHFGVVSTSTNPVTLTGLTTNTRYNIKVRVVCGDDDSSLWSQPVQIITNRGSFSHDIVQFGEVGSDYGYNTPINGYFRHTWTQMIYPADSLRTPCYIDTIWFSAAAVGNTQPQDTSVTVYMGHTPWSVHPDNTSWFPADSLMAVAHSTVMQPQSAGWFAIPLTIPFYYNGVDNLAIAVSYHGAHYSTLWNYHYNPVDSAVLLRFDDNDVTYGNHPGITTSGNHSSLSAKLPVMRMSISNNATYCILPASFTADEVHSDSVALHWSRRVSDSLYLVSYNSLDSLESGSVVTTDTSITVTGLNQLTSYLFKLRTICTNGDTSLASIFNVNTPERCLSPSDIHIVNPRSADAATVCWRAAVGTSQWQVSYGAGLTNPDAGALAITNDTAYMLPSLVAGQNYSVFVRTVCGVGDTGFWNGPVSFKAGVWTMLPGRTDTIVTCNTMIKDSNFFADDTLVIFPSTPNSLAAVQGTVSLQPYNNWVLEVNVYDGVGTNGTLLGTYTGDTVMPTHISTQGPLTLVFNCHDFYDGGFLLYASCLPDNGCHASPRVVAHHPLDTSVSLNWLYLDEMPASFTVAYAPVDLFDTSDASTYQVVSGITDTAFVLGGLLAGTHYKVAVRAECGNGVHSRWTLSNDFYTSCMAITRDNLPFSEDFSSWGTTAIGNLTSVIDPCWFFNSTGSITARVYHNSPNNTDLNHYINMSHYGNSYSALVLPLFADSIADLTVTYAAQNDYTGVYDQYVEVVEIGVLDDPRDFNTYTAVSRDSLVGGSVQHFTKRLDSYTGSGRYIAIVAPLMSDYHSGYGLNVAQIQVTMDLPCMPPLNINVDSVSQCEATLAIVDTTQPDNRTIVYGTSPLFSQSDSTFTSDLNPVTISGLRSGKRYYVWVRNNNTIDRVNYSSPWTGPVSFETLSEPQPVYYQATAFSNDSSIGSVGIAVESGTQNVSSSNMYSEGSRLVFTATPIGSASRFLYWNDGDTTNPRILTLTQDTSLTAFFAVDTTTESIVSPQFTFRMEPNPASTEVKLTAMQNILSVECYDLQGRCVASLKPSAPQCSLEVADWPRGIYMIKVYSGNAVAVRKLIVK